MACGMWGCRVYSFKVHSLSSGVTLGLAKRIHPSLPSDSPAARLGSTESQETFQGRLLTIARMPAGSAGSRVTVKCVGC